MKKKEVRVGGHKFEQIICEKVNGMVYLWMGVVNYLELWFLKVWFLWPAGASPKHH